MHIGSNNCDQVAAQINSLSIGLRPSGLYCRYSSVEESTYRLDLIGSKRQKSRRQFVRSSRNDGGILSNYIVLQSRVLCFS
jgi:hypothetical protein